MIRQRFRRFAIVVFTAAGLFGPALLAVFAQETFDDLRFRSIGPAVMGGRIDAVAVVESRPSTMYVGTASGGLWKTTNAGTTWTPLLDDEITSSIGDVAVAPSDPDVVWVGTGEPNNRQSSTYGHGVYRSMDGGRSFEHVGLERTHHIGRVIVHPADPNRVYVAALGPLWASSPERGVFRTVDGGRSWRKVLFVDRDTGVVALAIDPVNPNVLYAAAYQRRRTPWGFVGGGSGGGIYKTVDGGDTWRKLANGIPEGPLGRIGLAIHRRDPDLVLAIIEHAEESGLYRSTDRGESFERINELNPRPMYYSKLHIDPNDPERIYVLGSSFHVSDDGGETFTVNRDMTPTYDVGVHGDHHALWIDPAFSDHLVLGGDGGLYVSWDRGTNWDKVNNIPLTQFYAIAVDLEEPYNVYGGAQDTHSWGGPSATRNHIGILNEDWFQINFGDGMYQAADPTNPDIVFTESQGGNIVRVDRRSGDRKVVKPHPEDADDEYRFHWTSPFLLSRHDPATLYFGGERLFTSRDRGDTWAASRDLTRNEDRDELAIFGEVPDEGALSLHDGVAEWGTITTIAESPLDATVLWVGTDDGRLWVTRDAGESFESVEDHLPGIDPLRAKISRVAASARSVRRAYASVDRHHLGDFTPYLFVTEDLGATWRRLGTELGPVEAGWVNVVAEHPRNGDLLFVGAERGLFMSLDRGESWLRMRGNFPNVPVDDLVIHPRDNDLVVGTHGRSIYILDDLTPLERHRPGSGSGSVALFEPRPATLFLPWKHESYGGQRQFIGENPPYGALVSYYLPSEVADGVKLRIHGGDGTLLWELEGPGEPGFQRIAWDLRTRPAEGMDEGDGQGPRVPPGRYQLELLAGAERKRSSVEVVLDPRLDIQTSELEERFDFLRTVDALRGRVGRTVSRAQELAEEIERVRAVLGDNSDEEIVQALASFADELAASRQPLGGGPRSFRNPSLSMRIGRLFQEFTGSDVQQGTLHGPTPVHRARLARLEEETRALIDSHQTLVASSLEALNEKLRQRGPLRIGSE